MRRFIFIWVLLAAVGGCYEIPHGPAPVPVDPNPPTPVVTSDSLWLITIEDKAARAPNSITTQAGYWFGLRKAGHDFSHIDAGDDAAAKYKPQIDAAGGIPCLIILDRATKKQLAAVRLPADKAGVDALIKKYSGK